MKRTLKIHAALVFAAVVFAARADETDSVSQPEKSAHNQTQQKKVTRSKKRQPAGRASETPHEGLRVPGAKTDVGVPYQEHGNLPVGAVFDGATDEATE